MGGSGSAFLRCSDGRVRWGEPTGLPGYLINVNYPYDNALPIEGFDQTLIDRWRVVAGDQPLTEPALITAGVYGNRISFSYRVLVRNNGDAGYHQRLLQDTLTMAQAPAPAESAAPTTAGHPIRLTRHGTHSS